MNVFANIFQIHHGGGQVLVAQPFLKLANAANIVL